MTRKSKMTPISAWPLFSYGFRPFFLLAAAWAAISVPVWVLAWSGQLELTSPLWGRDWHAHEMIFGYGMAVLAGFLFTSIPNWTGRMPRKGAPLVALALLWAAGRVCLLLPVPLWVAAMADIAFPLALLGVITTEIVAGRNWRNLIVIAPVSVFTLADAAFWGLALRGEATDPAARAGLAALLFLVTLIGGRITPSFTRNWLAKQGTSARPTPANRFDQLALATGGVALLAWIAAPDLAVTGGLAIAAGVLHTVRLARWRGDAVWRNALLLMLHLSYAALALGLIALGASILGLGLSADGALHILAPGAIGAMTLAVMIRASSGHTGRSLSAGPMMTAAFGAVITAGLIRGLTFDGSLTPLIIVTLLWSFGFAAFVARIGPWLLAPSAARKRPNPAQKPA